jgi:hypothetical protein
MMQPSDGSQPDPKAKQFAQDYAGQVAQLIQKAQDERAEKYPLLTGQVGTTIQDRSDYYV